MRWFKGIRTVAPRALRLSGTFKQRLDAPHVQAMAASTGKVGRINLPAICWKLNGELWREVAAGEDRVAASLLANGMDWDKPIEVRTFDGDEQDVLAVRAHENAHRRHDDRDAWLAGLARAEADLTQNSEDSSGPESPEDPEAGGVATGKPAPEGTSLPAPAASLDPPDNVAQGFDEAVFTSARIIGWTGTVEQQAGRPSVPSQAVTVEGPREKASRRKQAAALATEVTGKPVTAAAVKQAEYRERKRTGKVHGRQRHDDGNGALLGEVALDIGKAFGECATLSQSLVTRLGNLLRKYPMLGERFALDGTLQAAKDIGKALRAFTPEAVCVYCAGKGEKAACQACRGLRFSTKKELAEAPPELLKAAGL